MSADPVTTKSPKGILKKTSSGTFRVKPASEVPPPPDPVPATLVDLDETLRKLQHKILPYEPARPGSLPDRSSAPPPAR